MENQENFDGKRLHQKIQSLATRHHQRLQMVKNPGGNYGSTASGSDLENPPAARRGPVQPEGPPPNWRPAPWKRFRRGG